MRDLSLPVPGAQVGAGAVLVPSWRGRPVIGKQDPGWKVGVVRMEDTDSFHPCSIVPGFLCLGSQPGHHVSR